MRVHSVRGTNWWSSEDSETQNGTPKLVSGGVISNGRIPAMAFGLLQQHHEGEAHIEPIVAMFRTYQSVTSRILWSILLAQSVRSHKPTFKLISQDEGLRETSFDESIHTASATTV